MTLAHAPPPAAAPKGLRALGEVHWRGIATIAQREITVYIRFWPVSLVGPVLSMTLYLLVFLVALGPARASETGDAILDYMAPGLTMMALLQWSAQGVSMSFMHIKILGVLPDMLVTPLKSWEMIAGYVLANTITGLVTGTPVLIIMALITGINLAIPVLALLIALLAAAMMASIGYLIGLACRKWDGVTAWYAFLIIPLAFLSGTFAPIDRLPDWAQTLMHVNPIYYAIDAFRGATLGLHDQTFAVSLAVMAGTMVAMIGVGHWLTHRGWRLKS